MDALGRRVILFVVDVAHNGVEVVASQSLFRIPPRVVAELVDEKPSGKVRHNAVSVSTDMNFRRRLTKRQSQRVDRGLVRALHQCCVTDDTLFASRAKDARVLSCVAHVSHLMKNRLCQRLSPRPHTVYRRRSKSAPPLGWYGRTERMALFDGCVVG